jgi:hypothetical protein
MRHLLTAIALSIVSSISYSALAEGPAPKEEAKSEAKEGHAAEHAEGKGEHAEGKGEGGEEGEEKEPKFVAAADMVLGFGNLPEEDGVTPSTLTGSFLLGGKYFFTPEFAIGARWPFTAGSIKEGEASKTEVAVGNVEVAAEYGVPLTRGLKLPIEVGFAIPTASGDAFDDKDEGKRRRAALNEAAAAARGGENNALFAAHRFGVVPLLGLEYERNHIEAAIWTKMEFLLRVGGASAPPPIEQKQVAMESVTGAGFFYSFLDDKLAVGTRVWVSAAITEETENPDETNKPSKVQVVVEPGLKGKFGAFRPSLSYIAPIAGALGDRKVGGVRLVLGLAY